MVIVVGEMPVDIEENSLRMMRRSMVGGPNDLVEKVISKKLYMNVL